VLTVHLWGIIFKLDRQQGVCGVTWQRDNDYDEETDYEVDEVEPPRRRRLMLVIFLVAALTGIVSAFAWRTYGGSAYPSFAFGSSPTAPAEPKMVGLDEFHAFQQQVGGQLQVNAETLAAQQAEVKRLSEQMAALSAKIDALQSAITSARADMPAPARAKKPKPSPSISTGGAPLPPPVELTH
jgi:uncharacterized coiled-coil protein SlyX